MKKIISLALCLILVFSFTLSAFANTTEYDSISQNSATVEIVGGKLHSSTMNGRNVAILTNDAKHLIDISISYCAKPNTVYQWTITDYPTAFDNTDAFWKDIICYAEDQMHSAKIVQFTETTYNEPIEVPQTFSSAGADLLRELSSLIGTGEYFGALKYTTNYQGEVFRVYESMEFKILFAGSNSWSTPITVSSLVVGVLGLVTTSSVVAAICGAFGIAASASSLLPSNGTINKYVCRAMNYRYVTVNGSEYAYNLTDKLIDYQGYENADLSNAERAYIDSGSRSVSYTHSSSYFDSYTLQIQDAYTMFERIGQMD